MFVGMVDIYDVGLSKSRTETIDLSARTPSPTISFLSPRFTSPFPHLSGLHKLFAVIVDRGRLRHEARNLPANLMDAGLVTRVNLVRGRALLAEVVDLLLESGVAVDGLAMSDKQLRVCIFSVERKTKNARKIK